MRAHPLRAMWGAIAQAASGLRNSWGWKQFVFAMAAGAFSALAFAPFGFFPLLLLGYAALVLILDGAAAGPRPLRNAALSGWAFGFGQFLIGLYWVGFAFLVDPAAHAWLIPFVALLLPGGLALFTALAAMACMLFWPHGNARIFVFAFAFGGAEWLRGHLLTGFPWNLPAYGWEASLAILQSASVIGAYGLSILTILFGGSLALLFPPVRGPRRTVLPAAMTILFLALWAGGMARLAYADDGTVPDIRLRIVQPNVPQSEKYVPQYRARNWQRLLDLSREPAAAPPTHIIWPEAAPPFILAGSPAAFDDIAGLTAKGTVLLTGTIRVEREPETGLRFYNSFFAFGRGGALIATYDKFHLVPFGEYMPLQAIMDAIGITKVTNGPGGFAAGDGPRTLDIPGAPPAGPLICYEVIFPGEVTGSPRPQWLINLTDDSWFGPGTGPEQHLLIARVRAVEEGLPIARAANSGISAVIDAYGRLRGRLNLNTEGVLDANLPAALPPTVYARFGSMVTFLLLIVLAAAALWPLERRGS